jgi:hypothetical protein
VSTLAQDVMARNRDYEQKRKTLEDLDAEVAAKRSRVDVNNAEDVAAFRDLLARRDAAADEFATKTSPDYSAMVDRYNGRVSAFNGQCSGKTYDPAALASVRAALACPKE